ncbi:MAG TPA: arsenate reductase ArsC, partial [Cellvibrionaceae bacterium]|nr:arsenate reductase ArsC [Cellvibrionaceae bacterium]
MKLLFICTHNRCRSILSEAITNHLGAGVIQAFSAGSAPAGQVHPLTLKFLQEAHIPTQGLASKSWDLFADLNPTAVISLCDSAAAESCPLWMGDSLRLHWGLADPSKLAEDETAARQAFNACIAQIKTRTQALVALHGR